MQRDVEEGVWRKPQTGYFLWGRAQMQLRVSQTVERRRLLSPYLFKVTAQRLAAHAHFWGSYALGAVLQGGSVSIYCR